MEIHPIENTKGIVFLFSFLSKPTRKFTWENKQLRLARKGLKNKSNEGGIPL